jgi:hypothetical protein
MIEPHEIQKGRLFNYTPIPNYPTIVVTIKEMTGENVTFSFKSENGLHEGNCPRTCLSGIPLTPEWIEKLGFIKDAAFSSDSLDWYVHEKHQNVIINPLKNPFPFPVEGTFPPMFIHSKFSGMPVLFVHRLQDYFSHDTNEELTIK